MANGSNTNSSGESDVDFDYTKAVDGTDNLSDKVMAEIARRLQAFTGSGVSGAVVGGESPPQDTSKLWDKGDGQVYRYDLASAAWLPTTATPPSNPFPGVSEKSGNIITLESDGIAAVPVDGRIIDDIYFISADDPDDPFVIININPPFPSAEYFVSFIPLHDMKPDTRWYETVKTASQYKIKLITAADYVPDVGSTVRVSLFHPAT